MKLYFAATLARRDLTDFKLDKRIISYHLDQSSLQSIYLQEGAFINNGVLNTKVFLDSGAFTAFTKGVEVDIHKYIDYLKKHESNLDLYSNLDVIGDSIKTWENQKLMERNGLTPLPCFHYGENLKWLKKYMENYDYLALGGMVPVSTPQLRMWLDDLFTNYICDSSGIPKIKIHGFGMTIQTLMLRYPWYSLDSTSWTIHGNMGDILVPVKTKGEYNYKKSPIMVNVSTRSSPTVLNHYTTQTELVKQHIKEYLNFLGYKYGRSKFKTVSADRKIKENESWASPKEENQPERLLERLLIKGVSNSHVIRKIVNTKFYKGLVNASNKWPWKFKIKKRNSFKF